METKNILITMKNGDQIKAELYPEIAPETVENFLNLTEKKRRIISMCFVNEEKIGLVINGMMLNQLLVMHGIVLKMV